MNISVINLQPLDMIGGMEFSPTANGLKVTVTRHDSAIKASAKADKGGESKAAEAERVAAENANADK